MSTTTRSLPLDTWVNVFSCLQKDPSKTLKNLMLVCRTFYMLGVPILFSKLRVSNGDPTYNFIAISTKPRLAQHVRRIEFDGPGAAPYLLQINSYDKPTVGTLSYPLLNCSLQFHDKQDIIRNLDAYASRQARVSVEHFKQKVLYWQENRLADLLYFRLSNGLGLDLSVFPRLQAIETSTAIFLQGSSFFPINAIIRQRLKLMAMTGNEGSARTSHSQLDYWRLGAQEIGATVVRISLYKIQEILASHRFGCITSKHIRHLKIDLSASEWSNRKEWEDCEGNNRIIAPWVTEVSGLETLTLVQNPKLEPALNILRELSLGRSPMIRKVDLVHATTAGNTLSTFATNRGGPLKDFWIHEPLLTEDAWEDVRNVLEERSWSFENLELSDAYKPEGMTRVEWDNQWRSARMVPFPGEGTPIASAPAW